MVYDSLYRKNKIYYQINYISGACFAIRTSTIKRIGLFDPLYFMYKEDDDLCRRVKYTNKKIVLVKNAKVMHISRVDTDYSTSGDYSNTDIYRLKRVSNEIYILKDINKSLLQNMLIIFRKKIEDYLNIIGHIKFGAFANYVADDIRTLFLIKNIISSRNKEINIVIANKLK